MRDQRRSLPVPIALAAAALAAALYACSQTAQNAAGAQSAAAAASPAAESSPIPEQEFLCRLPDLPPAELRAKLGYTQLQVLATDANGAPLTGLKQSDFVVKSGAQTLPIAYFHEQSTADTPVSIVVVLDESASMYDKLVMKRGDLGKDRMAVDEAVGKLNECDEGAVVTIGGEPAPNTYSESAATESLAPVTPRAFTTDIGLVMEKIYGLEPHGEDRLAEGISFGLSTLAGAHYPDRALIVVTDGLDPSQVEQGAHMLAQVRVSGTRLWVIGVGDPNASTTRFPSVFGTTRVDVDAIERLAAAGSGRALFANPIDDDDGASMATAIDQIVPEAGSAYTIGVVAPAGDPTPTVALAPTHTGAIARASVVAPELLAEAVTRPPPRPKPAPCVAQNTPPSAPPAEVTSKPGYAQVQVSVTDAAGSPVSGLKQSDFDVSSAGANLRIAYFDAKGPQSIVIAIDTSGSMQPKLETVRREFGKLISDLDACDEVALVAFASKLFLLQDLTADHRLVRTRLWMLHAYGPTALYDTLDETPKLLSKAKFKHRSVVLVTDGMDNASTTTRDIALADAHQQGVAIYAIGIGDPNASALPTIALGPVAVGGQIDRVDKPTLDAIASYSGGEDFIVPPMSKDGGTAFAAAVANISAALNGGYEVGVIAPPGSPPPTVAIRGRPDLVVHVRPAAAASAPSASAAAQ
jgi:VWFA-related protein